MPTQANFNRKMARNKFVIYLLLGLLCIPATAMAEFQPFSSKSLAHIRAARDGRPFLLVLWSISCPPCLQELEHLGQLQTGFMPDGLVLISTDGPEYADEALQVLSRYGLAEAENWHFTGNFPERLRYYIDPDWYGELPRAYFYDADHERMARSGVSNMAMIRQWIAATRQMMEGMK